MFNSSVFLKVHCATFLQAVNKQKTEFLIQKQLFAGANMTANFEVLVLYLSISISCYFIFLLHYISLIPLVTFLI